MNDKDRKAVIAAEQAAVDRAYGLLERSRAINKKLQEPRPWNQDCPESGTPFIHDTPPELKGLYDGLGGQSLVVARVDVEEPTEAKTYYIGRRTVKNPANEDRVVINWSSKLGTRWLLTLATEPGEVLLRRRLRCNDRRVVDYSDDIDRRSSPADAPSGEGESRDGRPGGIGGQTADGFLLEEINRARGDHMRDIVATIERDQLRLVARDPKGVLVVQGGPGTGKTAVGLHRVAWILDPDNGTSIRPSEILMVVPHRDLLDYVGDVPSQLGVPEVTIKSFDQLWQDKAGGSDDPLARRVKSDERMAEVLHRALENTVRPHAVDSLSRNALGISLLDRTLRLSREDVHGCLREALNSPGSFQARRTKAVNLLLDRLIAPFAAGRGRERGDSDIRVSLQRNKQFTSLINRLWPAPSAPQLLRQLYASKKLLSQASAGLLTDEERTALSRPQNRPLSPEDLVCLDELRHLITGDVPRRYRHLVIDEAQDLTPMQARALARRCPSGSITVLGDLVQATGPHLHRSWDEVAGMLTAKGDWTVAELRTGYRTPREVIDFVAPLARTISSEISVPKSVRPPAKGSVTTLPVTPWSLLEKAVTRAVTLAESGGASRSVAVVTPDHPQWTDEAERCLKAAQNATAGPAKAIRVLPASQTKGLEFDHVVVVEPTAIAESGPAGLNLLYVVLTRCTQTLTVVHASPLPQELSSGSGAPGTGNGSHSRRPGAAQPVNGHVPSPLSSQETEGLYRRLLNEATADRQDGIHEKLRTELTTHLSQLGLRPEESPIMDIIRRAPDGIILYEVLGAGGQTYLHMRNGAARLVEAPRITQEKIHRMFLVLAGEPVEPWAATSLASVFGVSVIWKMADGWAGHDLDLALRG